MTTCDPPYNVSYTPLRDEDEEDEPTPQPPAPEQPFPQQPVLVPFQPLPVQTGVQYYAQPYPDSQGAVLVQPQTQPAAVVMQPTAVVMQPAAVVTQPNSTKCFPECTLIFSIVTLLISTVLLYLPGFLCLIPAMVLGIVAVNKKDENKPSEAKKFSIISLVLLVVFAASFPILFQAWISAIMAASFSLASAVRYY